MGLPAGVGLYAGRQWTASCERINGELTMTSRQQRTKRNDGELRAEKLNAFTLRLQLGDVEGVCQPGPHVNSSA